MDHRLLLLLLPPPPPLPLLLQTTTMRLDTPLTLRSGVELRGRVCKSAMTENLADELNRANERHVKLYGEWSRRNGAGALLITGNVPVDRRYLEKPGNVVIDGVQDADRVERLKAWASAAQQDGTVCFVQISHAGLQSNGLCFPDAAGPSDYQINNPAAKTGKGRAMTTDEVKDVVRRFAHAAKVCKEAGFAGVQLHGAHGYLLSSFLSPKYNTRTDEYGGAPLENRARLLLESVRAVKEATGPGFGVAVKMNSADFQKGGMTTEEAAQVASWLENEGIDFLEVSGGNYETGAMSFGPKGVGEYFQGKDMFRARSTKLREGYFMEFAPAIKRALVKGTPLMVTGGFRTRAVMEACLEKGELDLVGVARPTCGHPDCVGKLVRGEIEALPSDELVVSLPWYVSWLRYLLLGNLLRDASALAWCGHAMVEVSEGRTPDISKAFDVLKQMGPYDANKAKALQGMDELRQRHDAAMATPSRVLSQTDQSLAPPTARELTQA